MKNSIGKPQFNKRGLIYGVGVNDYPYSTKINGVEIKPYRVWKDMIKRCYSNSYKEKNPCYKDVICCNDWLYFSKFLEDTSEMNNSFCCGFDMDKDVLGDGKIYSKGTVCFLPSKLNSMLGSFNKTTSKFGLGVRFLDGRYVVRFCSNGREVTLGRFSSLEDAQIISMKYRVEYLIKTIDDYSYCVDEKLRDSLMVYVKNKLFN